MPDPTFDGITYDPALDRERLAPQLRAVFDVLAADPGRWWVLEAIANECRFALDGRRPSMPSVSARIRDLRKPRNGGWQVERRRHPDHAGLWQYRLGQRGFYTEPEPADPTSTSSSSRAGCGFSPPGLTRSSPTSGPRSGAAYSSGGSHEPPRSRG